MLWLARHGSTKLNDTDISKDRIRGWKDIPLDGEGKKEAEALGKFFSGKGIKKIYSSDLQRAMDTAHAIKQGAGVDSQVIPTKSLRPWHLGNLEGKPVKEILDQMKYHAEHPNVPVPGGESFHSFLNRFLPFLRSKMGKEGTLLVGHYRNLKAAHAWVENGMKGENVGEPDKAVSGKLPTGAVLKVKDKVATFVEK